MFMYGRNNFVWYSILPEQENERSVEVFHALSVFGIRTKMPEILN